MATMIPPILPNQNISPGERDVFLRIKDDPATRNWVVLHSLDVAEHRRQIFGELDFVVIIPHQGVICLEIKSHLSIKREGGLWYYGRNPKGDPRGPFKQASEAMHSIRQHLTIRHPSLSRIVFWSAAVFPYAPFETQSTEWHPWQVIDNQSFRAHSISSLLLNIMAEAKVFLETKETASWFDPLGNVPTEQHCKIILDTLRPDFEYFESPQSRSERLLNELKYYTSEQFAALDAMEENPRVVFRGPAGTGKTMLAIEAARRSAEGRQKTLLLCFNNLLGLRMSNETEALKPFVTTKTLHAHMLKLAKVAPKKNSKQFWEDELPNLAIEQLLENASEEDVFDEIIIDEAQDILREPYLDFLDLSLRGGLASGKWKLFGDFEKQAIYEAANVSIDEFRKKRGSNAPVYSLRTNCRNTPRIVSLVHLLGGLYPHYSKTLRPDDRIDPDYRYYNNRLQQQELLARTLTQLERDGTRYTDIVILSPRADRSSASSEIVAAPWKHVVKPYNSVDTDMVRYCSISAFKGMEAPVIIVTDIEQINSEQTQALFYIAVTRSIQRLILLMHTSVQADILALLATPSQ